MKITISELENILIQVARLKSSAQTNSDFEDYDEALTDLNGAIALLYPRLEELNELNKIDSKAKEAGQYEIFRFKFARELADCHGMKGGNYRRKKDFEQAEKMYDKGSHFEIDYDIPDTYNRTNVIVLKLLRTPQLHQTLKSIIQGARRIVQEQVVGKNSNKWWAWADYGLLNLLCISLDDAGQRTYYQGEAHIAYEKFKGTGAGKQNFESTISVLEQLKKAFEKVGEETTSLIQEEINYLNENMPRY